MEQSKSTKSNKLSKKRDILSDAQSESVVSSDPSDLEEERQVNCEVSIPTNSNLDFKAGRLKDFLSEWKKLTNDPFIIGMVQGASIPLDDLLDIQNLDLRNYKVPGNQHDAVQSEIAKLLDLGVIEKSKLEKDQIVSPIFLVKKPDGSYRMILDLKDFNQNVSYEHFKMENLDTALLMVTKDCFMASIDLKHAYYSVPIKKEFRKYLKFSWKGNLYHYTCFPNGLSCCPRFFTKLLKPVYAKLRSQGYLSTSFIDDSFLMGNSYNSCKQNVEKTVQLFESLGFYVYPDKSVFRPTQKLKYLGFIIDSKNMSVKLTDDRTKH